jgi:hypothetical protein
MTPSRNPRQQAALASLHAAFGPATRTTRPAPIVTPDPRSRREFLSLERG